MKPSLQTTGPSFGQKRPAQTPTPLDRNNKSKPAPSAGSTETKLRTDSLVLSVEGRFIWKPSLTWWYRHSRRVQNKGLMYKEIGVLICKSIASLRPTVTHWARSQGGLVRIANKCTSFYTALAHHHNTQYESWTDPISKKHNTREGTGLMGIRVVHNAGGSNTCLAGLGLQLLSAHSLSCN